MPNAPATPLPYAGSAFRQFPICLSLISLGASPIARPVFSNKTFCCAGALEDVQLRSRQVEAIKVHHLGPARNEVLDKLLLRVRASVDLG